jgi:hypothetical protein
VNINRKNNKISVESFSGFVASDPTIKEDEIPKDVTRFFTRRIFLRCHEYNTDNAATNTERRNE